ncbi:hypothetical protein KFE25_008103 [Diacronema lutheri]|uniref:Fe2OG dioxygenase domain-containing protein n=1 Tax=Diacronema lutheri TaxID=2081491 RepID=A0A8J5XN90_DIALT|nr:hypothetical protein KFE25_008103 [Diacronema lutheri]
MASRLPPFLAICLAGLAAGGEPTCAEGTAGVPVMSLASVDPAEIDRALREVGFLAIVDHGVDERVIDAAWRTAAEWFSRPREEKARAPLLGPDYPYGYSPLHSEAHPGSEDDARARAPGDGPPTLADEKEMLCIGPENGVAPARRWPEQSDELRVAWLAYFDAMVALSDRILELFARALRLDDDGWFSHFNRRHASALRAINYPALDADLAPGQLRSSAHTDYGALTILRVGGPGLQIFNRAGAWVDVPSIEPHNGSAFVINLGDLMSRWTNNRWLSTPHRVVVPPRAPDTRAFADARQALAFFHNMDMDALIETIPTCREEGAPLRYAPILAGEHLMKKHEAATRGEALNIYAATA